MPVIFEERNSYTPTTRDIGRTIRAHNNLILIALRHREDNHREEVIKGYIAILKLHREIMRRKVLIDRSTKTIEYWHERLTREGATWKVNTRGNH